MIEREFLFWVIVGTSLISYGFGYFLWLFVHWYYDERPKTRTLKVHTPTWTIKWEENMKIIKENNKKIEEVMIKASKKLQDHIEKEILSSLAKTSGESGKKGDDKLPPKEKPDPYWAIVSPKGQNVFIQKSKFSYDVFKHYAENIMGISTLTLDARGYKVKPYTPASPPPPPSPLYNHLFHYERKPNA